MAGKIEGLADFDEQFLTCPVCMLHFRDPRILPCLHTFCKECLEQWAAKQQPLECPTCRTTVSLPDQGVAGLRTNFYVNNLLDFAAAKKGAEPGVACVVCEGGQDGVKSWCTGCALLLCEPCTKMHRRIPATVDHEVIPQETIKARGNRDLFQPRKHCSKHKSQELAFYCETCTVMICTACTVVDHRPGKDHNTVELSSVAQAKKENLQRFMQQLHPRMKDVREALKQIYKERAKLPVSREEAIDQATTYFRHLADLVKRQEEETLSQIDTTCQEIGKTLETQKAEVEFDEAGLTSAYEFCEQAVDHGSDVHIVEVEGQVQRRVEDLLAKQLDLTPRPGEIGFVENPNGTAFKKKLAKAVSIVAMPAVDISKCTLDVKPAVVGFVSVCHLSIKDDGGHPHVLERENITVNMENHLGEALETQLEQRGRIEWEISYIPQVTGNYRLEVKVNSQHVGTSPFYITVQSADTPVLTIGRKGSGKGEMTGPVNVAIDKDGNIAVVEQGNKRVQLFDFNPDKSQSFKRFPVDGKNPFGVAVGSDGRLFVTSFGQNVGIRCYSSNGNLLNTYKADVIKYPLGLTVLKDGRMVVVDRTQQCCFLLQHGGSLIRYIGKGQLQNPCCVALDESRQLMFVTDETAHKVFAFDLLGNFAFAVGKQGQHDGGFQKPTGIVLDPAGNIIVVNCDDGRLQVFRPNGTFKKTLATVKGAQPYGITLTHDGYIAVACFGGHCVQMYRYS